MSAELKLNRPETLKDAEVSAEVLRQLARAIGNIRYGSVEVVIHDSRVVQIEAREKIRFRDGGPHP